MEHLNEEQTRQQLIDGQLARAGWGDKHVKLIEELALKGVTGEGATTYADYALFDGDGQPIAIVEAKRTSRDEIAGKRQAADYADLVAEKYGVNPFIFLSNGLVTWFWDRERYPPREVSAFLSPRDLEGLRYMRRFAKPLKDLAPNPIIAGRDYQIEAIRRVTEAMEQAHRKFLLVMATGTGKTRTAVALIELLMRARWVRRVLFLVDRRELAKQAAGAFKEHMPDVLPHRIERGEVEDDMAIHIATYPSMMQVYKRLSPGYYDLVIADESHRSIYNRYKVLLDHFDGLQLGLTATPTDYIDHNTFDLFQCTDGLPTFYYPYEEAVQEGYLADYKVLEAKTTFQVEGIRAGELPEEMQRQLEAQGIDLSEIDFEGSDLERRVTNTGTNDAIVREFMDQSRKDATGTLPAKTIIFCISHRHAKEIWKSFNRLCPDFQRRGFAEIIDSHMEGAEDTLDDFKRKDMPRVAISVDMLDTGIDVPEIQNLVFAKPVYSQVKFWQMIGRGTRRWTNEQTGWEKKDFLIIDHWDNFSYFKMKPEGEVAGSSVPLPVRLFRARLDKMLLLQQRGSHTEAEETAEMLRGMLAVLPDQNTNVRPHTLTLQHYATPEAWRQLTDDALKELRNTLAPLCRFMPDVNLETMMFELRTEQLTLAHFQQDDATVDALREKVEEDLKRLPTSLQEVAVHTEALQWALSDGFWENLSYDRTKMLQETFAPLMRYRRRKTSTFIRLSLPDEIASRRWIMYGPSGEGAFADSYRAKVEAYVRMMAQEDPILDRLRVGDSVSEEDLHTLARRLETPDLYVTEDVLREVYEQPDATLMDFLRHMLGVSRLPSREDQIRSAFDEFLHSHPQYTAIQLNFLRLVRNTIIKRNRLSQADLEKAPFTRVGSVHQLFSEAELDELMAFADTLAA